MANFKADISIGQRMYSECLRLFEYNANITRCLHCSRDAPYQWEQGVAPSAKNLARLHYAGGDVIYVLTGRRAKDG